MCFEPCSSRLWWRAPCASCRDGAACGIVGEGVTGACYNSRVGGQGQNGSQGTVGTRGGDGSIGLQGQPGGEAGEPGKGRRRHGRLGRQAPIHRHRTPGERGPGRRRRYGRRRRKGRARRGRDQPPPRGQWAGRAWRTVRHRRPARRQWLRPDHLGQARFLTQQVLSACCLHSGMPGVTASTPCGVGAVTARRSHSAVALPTPSPSYVLRQVRLQTRPLLIRQISPAHTGRNDVITFPLRDPSDTA